MRDRLGEERRDGVEARRRDGGRDLVPGDVEAEAPDLEGAARGDCIQEAREVWVAELPFEFMMNALRLTDGVPTDLFEARTGIGLDAITPQLLAARQRGLLEADRQQLRPTARGQRFLNDLLQIFLKI